MIAKILPSLIASSLCSMVAALDLPVYTNLLTSQERTAVLEVTFHNPSSAINLWTGAMQEDLIDLVCRLQNDNTTKAVVFKSDRPEYFIAHADLSNGDFDSGTAGVRGAELLFNITNLQQATIGAVNGIARGGGNEFLIALDMRFATKDLAKFAQIEVGVGVVPGYGGTQYLSKLIGRGLALEYLLSSNDVKAEEAERIGWINKAFDTLEDMDNYVNTLTARLAVFSLDSMGSVKQGVNAATRPNFEDILDDSAAFVRRFSDPSVKAFLAAFTANPNNQSDVDQERNLADFIPYGYADYIPPTPLA